MQSSSRSAPFVTTLAPTQRTNRPKLNGLNGRRSGSVPDFNYSDANKKSDIVWNEETFKEYIQDPSAKIPGTKKIFAGIKSEQEITDLWVYLKRFDAAGNIKK